MGRKKRRSGKRREEKEDWTTETEPEPTSFPDIPEEITVEILARLPLNNNSLPRFMCVSKPWRSLISEIITKKTGRKKMALVQSFSRSGTLTFHSVDEDSHVKSVDIPWKNQFSGSTYPRLIGSCNGLLLMAADVDLFLWNPLTRYFKKVLSYEPLGKNYLRYYGFCYDSSANDYKALIWDHDRVVVGSFRSKIWSSVALPCKYSYAMRSGPVVNGHLHWCVSDFPSHQIFYFDPKWNKFVEVPIPRPKKQDWCYYTYLDLGVLDGCLCMVEYYFGDTCVEVLAMKEYGVEKSWTTLFVISSLTLGYFDRLEPFGYTKDGEAVMKVYIDTGKPWEIRAYNPNENSIRDIAIQPDCSYVDGIVYEESLATPTGYDWEEEELRGEATYVEYYLKGYGQQFKKRRDGSWEIEDVEQ